MTIQPYFDCDGVPHCSDGCPKHDGKRCEELGHAPDFYCVPAIKRLIAEVRRLQKENSLYLETIDALNGMVEQNWRPIEAAPKDEDVLGWIPPLSSGGVGCVLVVTLSDLWEHWYAGRDPEEEEYVTHWMPLPAPPKR